LGSDTRRSHTKHTVVQRYKPKELGICADVQNWDSAQSLMGLPSSK
jgi:hypothetical protein